MRRVVPLLLLIALVAVACSSTPVGPLPDPPHPTSFDELSASIQESDTATAVNVWASWCLPCRSEAPLLSQATNVHPDVRFIGLNVRDTDPNAQKFIAEFYADAAMTHVSDRSGRVPVDMGATLGVPITFFYARDGSLVNMHLGIIDEPTLARFLDEIDR